MKELNNEIAILGSMKLSFILVFCLLAGSFASAAITNYKVPNAIPLDQTLVVSGDTSPAQSNVYCDFSIIDVDTGNLVWQLTSEQTNSQGHFATSYYVLHEPIVFYNQDYNVTTQCGSDTATQTFHVGQRLSPDLPIVSWIFWMKDNPLASFVTLLGIILGVVILAVLVNYFWR